MSLFSDGIDKSDHLGDPPSEAFEAMMAMKALKAGRSLQDVVFDEYPHQGAEHMVRRARRNKKLLTGVAERLQTAAQLRVISDEWLGWPFQFAAMREGILGTSLARVKAFYVPHLMKATVLLRNVQPEESVYYRYLEQTSYFRVASTLEPDLESDEISPEARQYLDELAKVKHAEERLTYLKKAIGANRELMRAVELAGRSVAPMFRAIAAVNAVAFEWHLLVLERRAASKEELIALCERGKKACDEAANDFKFWVKVRRDAIEYTALLAYMLKGKEAAAMRMELEQELMLFASAFTDAIVADVLLMLRPNMEPAAQKLIKASAIYQRLCAEVAKCKSTARMKRELIAEIKQMLKGKA